MSKLVKIDEICQATGFSEVEIQDLVDRKQIPFLVFNDRGLMFPLEEVLARGIQKTVPKPTPPIEQTTPLPPVAEPVDTRSGETIPGSKKVKK